MAFGRLTNRSIDRSFTIDSKYASDIWTPDLYFQNEKEARTHHILKENIQLDISKDGEIVLSTRLTIKLHCFMDFSTFPFDSQICEIGFQSYAHRDYQIHLRWKDEAAIQFNTDLALVSFKIVDVLTQERCINIYNTGNFSCMKGFFVLQRDYGYYIFNCFIPSIMCVGTRI